MDNPEYTFQILEVFSKARSKEIPRELEEYISYVARTGDPVFQWSLVKVLIKEKLQAVLNEFMEGGPIDIPPCPNVDIFNYENLKEHLITHLDSFIFPPFTIQRICELLIAPRKEYNRIDKYMRAIEKNVVVVSASDLSLKRGLDGDGNDSVINGILYEKVNDSLSGFTNHVFTEEQDDELNVNSKLDETDAMQQIIDESWTEENNDEFKLNSSNNEVGFEHELQFVTDKNTQNDNDEEISKNASLESTSKLDVEEAEIEGCESSTLESSSVAEEGHTSLQNIIAESTNISIDNVSTQSEENFVDTSSSSSLKNNTFEFKDGSVDTTSDMITNSSVVRGELLETSDNELTNSADSSMQEDMAIEPVKSIEIEEVKNMVEHKFVESDSTDNVVIEQLSVEQSEVTTHTVMAEVTSSDEPMAQCVDSEEISSIESNEFVETTTSSSCQMVESTFETMEESSEIEETVDADRVEDKNGETVATAREAQELVEEKTFSSGDNQESNEKYVEESSLIDADNVIEEIETETKKPPEPSQLESDTAL